MLKLHSVVTLREDDEETGIPKGTVGAVVYIHNGGEAYTVEFINADGDTFITTFDKEFTESELQPNE